jgi:hypothetical protein
MELAASVVNAIIDAPWAKTFLPKAKKSTREHAQKIINWHQTQTNPNIVPTSPPNETIAALQNRINQERLKIYMYTSSRVDSIILRAAQQHDFLRRDDGQFPASIRGLKRVFVACTVDITQKLTALHYVLYQAFKTPANIEFDSTVELEYKDQYGITYAGDGGQKGCIGQVVNQKRKNDFRFS